MLLTGSAWATALELAFVGSGQSLVLVPAARLSKYLQLQTCSWSRHMHITDACLYLEHSPHCLDQSISSTQTCRVDCHGGPRTMPDLLSSALSPLFYFYFRLKWVLVFSPRAANSIPLEQQCQHIRLRSWNTAIKEGFLSMLFSQDSIICMQ